MAKNVEGRRNNAMTGARCSQVERSNTLLKITIPLEGNLKIKSVKEARSYEIPRMKKLSGERVAERERDRVLFHGQSGCSSVARSRLQSVRGKRKISNLPALWPLPTEQREPINDDFRLRGPTLKNVDQRDRSDVTAQRAHELLRQSKNFNYSLNASCDEIEF